MEFDEDDLRPFSSISRPFTSTGDNRRPPGNGGIISATGVRVDDRPPAVNQRGGSALPRPMTMVGSRPVTGRPMTAMIPDWMYSDDPDSPNSSTNRPKTGYRPGRPGSAAMDHNQVPSRFERIHL